MAEGNDKVERRGRKRKFNEPTMQVKIIVTKALYEQIAKISDREERPLSDQCRIFLREGVEEYHER